MNSPALISKLYHATSFIAWESIKRQGFKPGKYGMLGAGIYFAESQEEALSKAHYREIVIKATVNVGSVLKVPTKTRKYTEIELKNKGYDSILCQVPGKSPEWVIFDTARIFDIELCEIDEKSQDYETLLEKYTELNDIGQQMNFLGHGFPRGSQLGFGMNMRYLD